MAETDFIPELNGCDHLDKALLSGFRPRAFQNILTAACARVLTELKRDYYGGVEAYNLAYHLDRWIQDARVAQCGGEAGTVYAILDYFNAGLYLPRNIHTLGRLRLDSFRRYFWQRSLDNVEANTFALIKALAITSLLPAEWYPQSVLDGQIKAELKRLRIYREISINADLGLAPGGLDWMAQTTASSVTHLQEHLEAGRPWPVRLILDANQLCANRQVIAYGFKKETGPVVRFEIYEPDCICDEHAIQINLGGEHPVVSEICPPGLPVPLAGLICDSYPAGAPPAASLSPIQRNGTARRLFWRLRRWSWRSPRTQR
jgi:hypothetical protein